VDGWPNLSNVTLPPENNTLPTGFLLRVHPALGAIINARFFPGATITALAKHDTRLVIGGSLHQSTTSPLLNLTYHGDGKNGYIAILESSTFEAETGFTMWGTGGSFLPSPFNSQLSLIYSSLLFRI